MSKNIAVVILAGGGGRRLGGVIKANIKLNGKSLFDRVAANVENIEGPHILSIGDIAPDIFPTRPNSFPSAHEWVLLNDLHKKAIGPMAGLAAAVAYLNRREENIDYLLSVAVDSPLFPSFFCPEALEVLTDDVDVVVASHGGQIYPTNALWRLDSIVNLPDNLQGLANFGVKGLLRQLRVHELALDRFDPDNPCQNINNIADILSIAPKVKTMPGHNEKKDAN